MSHFERAVTWLFVKADKAKTATAAMPSPRRNRLAFIAGLISAAAFAPLDLFPLLLAAFALLVWLIDAAPSSAAAARTGWWFSFGQLCAGLYWIAIAWQFQANMPVLLGIIAVLVLSAYLALYAAVSCYVAKRFWHDGPSRIFLLAAFWALGEWLRGMLFTGFPWNLAGSAWLPVLPIAQAASFIGTYGLSILMVLAGGTFALLACGREPARKALINLGLVLLVLVAGGTLKILLQPTSYWPNLQLHIVQANIGQDLKWSEENFRKPLNIQLQITHAVLASRGPGIVIWPETAVPNLIDEEITTRYLIARALGEENILLTGADRVQRAQDGEILAAYNSLLALNGAGEITDMYDKVHLVPFGEYLPLRPLLDAIGISRLAPGAIDFLPGPKLRTLDLDKLPKVGPLICYEAIFPGQIVDRHNRPDWLLNISNDAWFGRSSGPWQHLAQARLRAIEEGLPMVRSTPTGITAVIDPHGRVRASLPPRKPDVLTSALPKPLPVTVYGRVGDLGFFLFAALTLFMGVRHTRTG